MRQALTLLLIICVSFSCRKVVQDEFDDFSDTATLNSILIVDSAVCVNLFYTGNVNSIELKTIENATVSLYVEGVFKETLTHQSEGKYIGSSIVESGKKYQYIAEISNHNNLTCEDIAPLSSSILSISHNNYAGKNKEGWNYPSVTFSFNNLLEKKMFYEVKIKTLSRMEAVSFDYPTLEKISDPILLNEGIEIPVFSNQLMDKEIYEMTLNYVRTSSSPDYALVLELRSVSEAYYEYAKSLYLYQKSRYSSEFSLTSQPVFNVYSNIENGFGIFATYTSFQTDTLFL